MLFYTVSGMRGAEIIGVNLMAGILKNAEADREGLVEAMARSTGTGLARGQSPSPKMNFALEMACFGELRATFCESLGDSLH